MSSHNINQHLTLNKYSGIVFESQFESLLDSIIHLAADQCHAPVALVTFVDKEKIYIYSEVGYPDKTLKPNKKEFCEFFSEDSDFFEICDSGSNKSHRNQLMYINNLNNIETKYYAGAKINLPLGELLGVLWILDVNPRVISETNKNLLRGLAELIEKALVSKRFLQNMTLVNTECQ